MRCLKFVIGAVPALNVCLLTAAVAGEVTGYAGGLDSDRDGETTYSWILEYRQTLSDSFAASLAWQNEGHISNHHRDGQAVQAWWRSKPELSGLVYELGVGPYRYYDTTRPIADQRYVNQHGWGVLASASVNWYFENRWVTSLRLNQIQAHGDGNSTTVVLGLGYVFDDDLRTDASSEPNGVGSDLRWEVDGALGEAIVNSFRSQDTVTEGIGARAKLNEYISASLTYVNARGTTPLGWRSGTLAHLWFEKALTQRFSIGAGAGAFLPADDSSPQRQNSSPGTSAVIGITGSYAIDAHWIGRITWDRLGTGDSRDADLILIGVGYRF